MNTKIRKRSVRGKVSFCLDVDFNGIRKRKFFKTQTDALHFRDNEMLDWLKGETENKPAGSQTKLNVARDEYLKEYLKANHNPSKPKQKGYQTSEERINRFLRFFGENRMVSEVTTQDYLDYVMSGNWSEETKAGYSRVVRTFMFWCGKRGYGQDKSDWYIKTNPELKYEKSKTFERLPEILSVDQAKLLLREIPEKYRPAMALMLFTGIRPEVEMMTLKYNDIQWGKRIQLRAEHTKTGRERWIKPPANLWTWIPKTRSGSVMPSYDGMNRARGRACRRAYGRVNNGRRGGGGVSGFDYPPNAARHSFGSYGYWISFEWALDTMGHMNSETFLKNYKNNRVDREDAEKYFGIVQKNTM